MISASTGINGVRLAPSLKQACLPVVSIVLFETDIGSEYVKMVKKRIGGQHFSEESYFFSLRLKPSHATAMYCYARS